MPYLISIMHISYIIIKRCSRKLENLPSDVWAQVIDSFQLCWKMLRAETRTVDIKFDVHIWQEDCHDIFKV